MTHTFTIEGLDDFEAEHIAQILLDYKTKMMTNKINAFVEDSKDGGHRAEWYDGHIAWYDEIMKTLKHEN